MINLNISEGGIFNLIRQCAKAKRALWGKEVDNSVKVFIKPPVEGLRILTKGKRRIVEQMKQWKKWEKLA